MESFLVYFSFLSPKIIKLSIKGAPLKIAKIQVQKGSTVSSHPVEQVTDPSNALQRKCSMI